MIWYLDNNTVNVLFKRWNYSSMLACVVFLLETCRNLKWYLTLTVFVCFFLLLLVLWENSAHIENTALLCLSIKIGAAPSDATVSTRKRQLCLQVTEQQENIMALWMLFLSEVAGLGPTFCRCLQSHLLGDRGQQKTRREWGKTGQACVSPWPTVRCKN